MSEDFMLAVCALLECQGYSVTRRPRGRPPKYGVPLTNADHQRLLRARRKAEKAGLTFNPREWITEHLGDGE